MLHRHRRHWLVALVILSLFAIPGTVLSGVPGWVELRPGLDHPYDLQVVEENGATTVRLRVHGFFRNSMAAGESRFETVSVPGAGTLRVNGRPELPTFGVSLLLDRAAEIVSVESETVLVDAIVPTPFAARPKRCAGGLSGRLTCDTELYNGVGAYPEASVLLRQTGRMRGQVALALELRPFRFLPGQRQLEVAVDMRVTLSSPLLREPDARLRSPSFDLLARGGFHQLLGPNRDEGGKELLLLVVHDDLLGSVDEFVAWKEAKGYVVVVMPLSEAGPTHLELKATLQDAYDNWPLPPTYVLLVGDGNGAGKVPFVPSPYGCASDFLYTTLDGDDLYSDVLIGRISAHTNDAAKQQLSNVIWYERDLLETGAGEWVPSSICISSSEGSGGSNDDVRSDIICDLQADNGYAPADKLYHSKGNDTASNISEKIDEGRGWLTYLGHGSGHSWSTTEPPYGTLDVAALQNEHMLPFVVDISCSNGEFDSNTGDCFAEVWMKTGGEAGPRAAIAIYSASMVTPWDEPAEMAVGMTKALLEQGVHNWSALAAAGRSYMMDAVPGGSHEEVCHQYVVFGDPTLQLRTTVPGVLTVSHPALLPLGSFPFAVTVGSGGQPVAGASVALALPGGGIVAAKTDAEGTVQMEVEAGVVGDATLTVTAVNAVPYIGTIETLVPGCGLVQASPVLAMCEAALAVQLFDADLNLSPSVLDEVVVSAHSVADPQGIALTLVETKLDSGKFAGGLLISAVGAVGSLAVGDSGTVTFSYLDEACDDGAGLKSFGVQVDCTAPTLVELSIDDVTATSATVNFIADEPTTGKVRFGVAEPLSGEAAFGGGLAQSVTLSGLTPDAEVLVEVYLVDAAGNEMVADNGGNYFKFTTLPCASQCGGKQCGPDGCGSTCGSCCDGQECEGAKCIGGPGCQVEPVPACGGCLCEDCVCSMDPYCCQVMWDDLCVEECLEQCGGCGSSPDCQGKECGANGCGGSCGECPVGWACTDVGQCVDNCESECAGKDCGPDGCGGNCGTCGEGAECVAGECLEECGGVDFVGCCDGDVQHYCEDGFQLLVDCAAQGLTCGWRATLGWYDCSEEQQADPSGTFPLWCPGVCPPECDEKECGPDGCGGTCGECGSGEVCVVDVCKLACEPQCVGLSCGGDGCGGQCGECPMGVVCEAGQCVNSCVPDCAELHCGDDGCGGICGQCAPGMSCASGQCVLVQSSDDARAEAEVGELQPQRPSGGCNAGSRPPTPAVPLALLIFLLVVVNRRTNRV